MGTGRTYNYQNNTKMKKLTLLCMICLAALSMQAQKGFTDLGLPSGTKWKNYNEPGFYTYDEAISKFGKSLPTKMQFEELIINCRWRTTKGGFIVTGPNGQSITLPAEGCLTSDGELQSAGNHGGYWSYTISGLVLLNERFAWHLNIDVHWESVEVDELIVIAGRSVRLIKK
jgi:hypothetical protein